MPALLEVAGLRAGYGRTEVLHGVDLEVPPGAAVALLGSNGAGKTTLLKTIAGLVPARDGQVLLQGEPVEKRPANARARAGICLIPEGRGIFRRLTVRENLTMQVGRRQPERLAGEGHRPVPQAGPAAGPAGRHALGRRAADAGPRPGARHRPAGRPGRRAVGGPGPGRRRRDLRGARPCCEAEGRSLLLVEQYVERAVGIADYVYILQKGEIVFVGEPSQCASGVVFARYLGASA